MASLIRYELRKIVLNKFGIGACAISLALLVVFCVGNWFTQSAFDPESGEYVHGSQAIAVIKDRVNAHGPLTPDQVRSDLADYEESLAVLDEFGDLNAAELYARQGREAVEARLRISGESYYESLNSFAMRKGEDGSIAYDYDLAQAASRNLAERLEKGHADGLPYTKAEAELWESRLADVDFPLQWGDASGWSDLAADVSMMMLAVISACIALSSVFAGEYQSGMAAVVLPCRYGKTKLVQAKVAASLLFALAYYSLCVFVCGAVGFAAFGVEGFGLPMQVSSLWSPYALSMGQYALIKLAFGYLVLICCVAIVLLLSAKLRSPMPAAVIPMTVIFLGFMLAAMAPRLERALALLPWNLVDSSLFTELISYGAGPFAVDLPVLALLLYGAIIAACIPLAMRAFAGHQVA